MAMSNILLKEARSNNRSFLLISYDGSSLTHYESQSLPSQHEFLFEDYCSVPSQKPSLVTIFYL